MTCTLVAGSGTARAQEAPSQLFDFCETGSGAGQCKNVRGIAANPENGRIFVSELGNSRISEFTATGEFVKAWGFGVADGTTEALQVCTTTCFAGKVSGQAGALRNPNGIALDEAGDVYVVDRDNLRVQKFSPEGEFVLMFGGDVNKTKVEAAAPEAQRNLCPVDPGDECQAGTGGAGNGQFSAGSFGWEARSNIAVSPAGVIHVGDENRIQKFKADGSFDGQIALPGAGFVESLAIDTAGQIYYVGRGAPTLIQRVGGSPIDPASGNPAALATDTENSLYSFQGSSTGICKYSSAGVELFCWGGGEFKLSTAIATNLCDGSEAPGNVYVSDPTNNATFIRAYGTPPIGCFQAITGEATEIEEHSATLNGEVNPKGEAVSACFFEYGPTDAYGEKEPCAQSPASLGEGEDPVPVDAAIAGLDAGTVYHFRLVMEGGGKTERGSDEVLKTLGPPVISDEHTALVLNTEATVKATVNPEGLATSCHVQYGTEGAFDQITPEQDVGEDREGHRLSFDLAGLDPNTTYQWRLSCENVSDQVLGAERELTTYAPFALGPCPNDSLRSGDSAYLPDCRAYEMVTPVDKNGGDILRPAGVAVGDTGGYAQSAPGGDKLTYASRTSFAGQPASFDVNQYIATRSGGGWGNEGIHPPVDGRPVGSILFGLLREFMAFTPDLCQAWLIDYQTPPPTADGQEGFPNLYRRDNCDPGTGGLEALTPDPPELGESTGLNYINNESVQGISKDGSHAFFVAKTALPHAPEAAAGTNDQIYVRSGGEAHLASVLPNGTANPSNAAVGSGWRFNLQNAASEDGSRLYWTANVSDGVGRVFLRLRPEQGKVAGECEAEGIACTRQVSGFFPARFWQASPDGSKALYQELNLISGKTDLFVYELEGEGGAPQKTKVATDIRGVAGASEDLARIYFVSEAALAGSGDNSSGEEAVGGEPNLYLTEEGAVSFIGTLTEGDVGEKEPDSLFQAYNVISPHPFFRPTRVTPDGSRLVFQSRAQLTGFDNTTAEGKPVVEVFTYQATSGELSCASCNPSRARVQAGEMSTPYTSGGGTKVQAAAFIPTWEHSLHASNALSADGTRIFFNSHDALLPRDTNAKMDVYEWEAPGKGTCSEASPSFFPQNGGCIYLISSGEGKLDSELWEASPDGDDVFFTTATSLVRPLDPGLIDIYDARVGGGIPQPSPEPECEGEACQSPGPPPQFSTPGSGSYAGPGNLPAPARSCARPARRAQGLSRRAKRARRAAGRVSRPRAARRMRGKSKRLAKRARRASNRAKRCRRARRGQAR